LVETLADHMEVRQVDMALEGAEEVVVVEAVVEEEATAPGDTSRVTDPLASVLSRRGEEVSKGIVRPAAGYIEAVSQTQNHS